MADEATKPTCFVIQSFDGGTFDRRYAETIRPALVKAAIVPQRADEILGLNPVIEKIESAIELANICLAEVSLDNPNVWLELGYALALKKPTIILCDKAIRPKLPFDVQHRPIIFYSSDSKSGFEQLEANIIKTVQNELSKDSLVLRSSTFKFDADKITDLEPYEITILATAFSFWPTLEGTITHWDLERTLSNESYTTAIMALGLLNLIKKKLIVKRISLETSGYDEHEVVRYQVTPEGMDWISRNKEVLNMKKEKPTYQHRRIGNVIDDDDIPF